MTQSLWQQFISETTISEDHGQQPAANSNILVDLSHIGLIELSGADAVTFLQGQVSNDVKQLTQGAHYSAYCTPKGRMLALFYAHSIDNNIYLQCPKDLVPSLIKRLRMYVMRSKVVIEDCSETLIKFGVQGTNLSASLSSLTLPAQPHQITHDAETTVIKLPALNSLERYEIIAPLAQAQALWQALSANSTVADANAWESIEIANGLPNVYANTQEQFVPQMLNLDLLNGINFKKGCYTGQEIVARTHYLGAVKRRTFIAHINSAQTPQTGQPVLDAQQTDCGQIVRVAKAAQGYDVLVECRLEAKEAGAITWQSNPLTWAEMPYAL